MTPLEATTFILGLAGALAWTPIIYQTFFTKTVIKGRLVGFTISPQFKFANHSYLTGTSERLEGIGYIPKFILIALHRDFEISHVKVDVKYPGESEFRSGVMFYAPEIDITLLGESEPKRLIIPSVEHINSLLALERNKPMQVFVPFCVRRPDGEQFESIKMTFTDFKKRSISVDFPASGIDEKTMMYEPKYWQ